jgi:TPR repeat protein
VLKEERMRNLGPMLGLTLAALLALAGCGRSNERVSIGEGGPVTPLAEQLSTPPEVDVAQLLTAAQSGDPEAQHQLGALYAKGEAVKQDYSEAVRWLELAAAAGHANSQHDLGLLYLEGLGVEQDLDRGRELMEAAAAQGHVSAMFNLGNIFANGRGVAVDVERAMRLYREAADGGSREAKLNLGVMYDLGQGVEQDFGKAMELYREASEAGVGQADYNLGVMYANGSGVPQDRIEAVVHFARAAWRRHPDAEQAIVQCFSEMSDEDERVARERVRTESRPPDGVLPTEMLPGS